MVVKAVRDRFDGKKRNPWNEFECGSNYARSMASYATIPILSGFVFDMPHNKIGFKPYNTENFKAIWSVLGAWGSFEMNKKSAVLKIYEGNLTLKAFELKGEDKIKGIFADGKKIEFKQENGVLTFDEVTLSDKLELEL